MTKTLIILAVALLVGCGKPAETSTSVGREFVVDKLFTHEGCTVYRFTDHGNARYFTNCQGSTNWTEGCGKGCTRQMDID
jgi:hypothetical protein